jgi:diadenosine tetraphosphate (Ap4A) HIT family hydrolase
VATFGYCQGADFCAEIGGETDLSFTRAYQGDPPSRRVATTEHFVVVIDISPLAVGHLLLLPKQHYFSFAQILAYDPYELYSLLEWLVPVYEATFGSPVILEHGVF